MPAPLVTAVLIPPKLPLAPERGRLNVTVTFGAGLLLVSFTSTTKGAAKVLVTLVF